MIRGFYLLSRLVWLLPLVLIGWGLCTATSWTVQDGGSWGGLLFTGGLAAADLALLAYLVFDAFRDTARLDPATRPGLASDTFQQLFVQLIFLAMGATVWPAWGTLVERSGEGSAKGHLVMLRDALAKHAARSPLPATLEGLVDAGAIERVPTLRLGRAPHPRSNASVVLRDGVPTDSGHWGYHVSSASFTLIVDCTHTDSKGSTWTNY